MSQRNPMNERYSSENRGAGSSRKSAASAKPKAKAAASVHVKAQAKTKEEKKAEQKQAAKQAKAEQRALDAKYYKPDTARYKKLRGLWWGCIVGSIILVVVMFLGRDLLPQVAQMPMLIVAYALIIAAFYIDFSKIRKERRAYQDRMILEEAKQLKEQKAAERAQRNTQPQAKKKGSGKNASRNPKVQAKAAAENAEAAAAEAAAAENATEETASK